MTVNELIGKLNALPEEQKKMEVAFFDDYRDIYSPPPTHLVGGKILRTMNAVIVRALEELL